MKIIVTGGSGLVGSEFTGQGYLKLSSKDVNLVNQQDTDSFFDRERPDAVIHCAAKVGGILGNINNKADFFYDNIMMNTNVIHSSFKYGVKKLVAFLSTCVFPNDVHYPLTVDKIHLGPPHWSNDSYAYAKRMTDVQIKAYKEQHGVDYKSVIPCNIYGPNDNYNLINGHVIPSLIHKCFLAKKNNTDWIIWGSGKPLREFIFSRDVAKLTEWILNNYKDSDPVILSSSCEVSIKDLTHIIARIFKFSGKIVFDESKPDGQHRKPSDGSKIIKLIPEFKYTPLERGLEETIDFFQKNYDRVRK